MPLDAEPTAAGNIVVHYDTDRGARVASVVGPEAEPTQLHYVSHFATCPNANDHRKKPDRDQ